MIDLSSVVTERTSTGFGIHTEMQSELIFISGALNSKDSIWILQKLHPILEELAKNYGLDIISKLARLGQRKEMYLQ
ncbi:hypothetical protein TNCV_3879441 [Trichonephila clavipes]|nr:hypothetical protein TNCV_3879441 [Trichonephila clavipes]